MTNILFYIISLIFFACCEIMSLLGKLLGWTYNEACVYVNLYLTEPLFCGSVFFVIIGLSPRLSRLSRKKVWVDKIFAVVMKKRSLFATLCRDEQLRNDKQR